MSLSPAIVEDIFAGKFVLDSLICTSGWMDVVESGITLLDSEDGVDIDISSAVVVATVSEIFSPPLLTVETVTSLMLLISKNRVAICAFWSEIGSKF